MKAADAKKVLESLKELVPDPETDFGPSYGAAMGLSNLSIEAHLWREFRGLLPEGVLT